MVIGCYAVVFGVRGGGGRGGGGSGGGVVAVVAVGEEGVAANINRSFGALALENGR